MSFGQNTLQVVEIKEVRPNILWLPEMEQSATDQAGYVPYIVDPLPPPGKRQTRTPNGER
jgi:hypothetical protein